MSYKTMILAALLLLAAGTSTLAQQPAVTQSWIDSPEAVFLTNQERVEWWTLDTEAERDAFKNRYWLQRDPTPDNGRLEFKEVVEKRIATADSRFPIEKTPGSRTARGMVFVLLGSPATARELQFDRNAPGQPTDSRIGMAEGNEYEVTWKYDLLRTPAILSAIDRPTLEITFIVEPSRRRDQLQNPGLVETLREQLAQRSIINPIPLSTVRKADTTIEPVPGPALPADIAAQLEDASVASSSQPVHAATFWVANGSPVTLVWFIAPQPAPGGAPKLTGRVRDSEQKNVLSVLRDVRPTAGFTTHGRDVVLATRLALPAGFYDSAFVAQQPGLTHPLATAAGRIIVPSRSASEIAVSSLVLTDTVSGKDGPGALSLGDAPLRPRADAVFMTNESLWYAFQVASASKPAGLKFSLMLRKRDGTSVRGAALPEGLAPAGEGLYVAAFEMPLASVAPGDYSLYVTVADGEGREQVRRADFKVTQAAVQ